MSAHLHSFNVSLSSLPMAREVHVPRTCLCAGGNKGYTFEFGSLTARFLDKKRIARGTYKEALISFENYTCSFLNTWKVHTRKAPEALPKRGSNLFPNDTKWWKAFQFPDKTSLPQSLPGPSRRTTEILFGRVKVRLPSTYDISDTLHTLGVIQWGRNHYYSHFTGGRTEVEEA